MSNPSTGEQITEARNSVISAAKVSGLSSGSHSARRWMSESLNRHNLTLLALISAFLAGADTIQSFYLQRVVNEFNEANLLPLKFYRNGVVGYILYSPIDFLALFATLIVLWVWASYLLWYYKQVISPLIRVRLSTD